MALNPQVLGALMKAKIDAAGVATRDAYFFALAEAVIEHFQLAGIVNTTVATTGTAAAQTGTGVGAIS